jgi:hypothetical protein
MLMLNKILKHPKLVDQEAFLVRVQFVALRYEVRLIKGEMGQ